MNDNHLNSGNLHRKSILLLVIVFCITCYPIVVTGQSSDHFQSKSDGLIGVPSNWLNSSSSKILNPCSIFEDHQLTVEHNMRSTCEMSQLYGDGELYLINGGTLQFDGDVELFGNSMMQVSEGSSIIINGDLTVSGSADVLVDGVMTVQGSIITKGQGTICGSGKLEVGGSIAGPNLCMNVDLAPLKKLHLQIFQDIDNSFQLKWTPTIEAENGYFIISKSDNGMTFHEISRDQIESQSNPKEHKSPVETNVSKTTYYRVIQFDQHDRMIAAEVVLLNSLESQDGLCELEIIPNPCVPSCVASLKQCPEGNYQTHILDARGNIVTELIPEFEDDGQIQYHINKDNFLLPGIYIISAKGSDLEKSKRMIVK